MLIIILVVKYLQIFYKYQNSWKEKKLFLKKSSESQRMALDLLP